MKIILSYNKPGWEGDQWAQEIRAASDESTTWIPFNHDGFVPIKRMLSAQGLDRLWQARDPGLLRLYAACQALIDEHQPDVLMVTNCPPYHPGWLRSFGFVKALWSTDDPGATYLRTVPYLGAYDVVFYLNPEFDATRSMKELLQAEGAREAHWLPHGYLGFDVAEQTDRPVDIVYVGHCFPQKLPALRALKREFGDRFVLRGNWKLKHNIYSWAFGGPKTWVKPVSFEERAALHASAKIGINLHWNEHGVGNQRLYYLPANGVLQICDGPKAAAQIFEPGKEIITCANVEEMIRQVRYYLGHPEEAQEIAKAGQRRAEREYKFRDVLRRVAKHLKECRAL